MKRILSVDDETSILKCYQRTLSSKGYESLVTDDPAEALEIIRTQELDLIMLDVRMPKMSGFELYEELKKKKRSVAVLFVTAYPGSFAMDSETVSRMWREEFADGNTDILYKPFDLNDLVEKVAGLIGPAKDE